MSVTEGQIRGKHNQDTDVPRSNFTDFKIILQTCAGLDQDDPLHAYVSDSPYK